VPASAMSPAADTGSNIVNSFPPESSLDATFPADTAKSRPMLQEFKVDTGATKASALPLKSRRYLAWAPMPAKCHEQTFTQQWHVEMRSGLGRLMTRHRQRHRDCEQSGVPFNAVLHIELVEV
jgi:hypothetical protein